ncbi:MAG: immunoglobulin domain-containing protein, partial [Methanothrix sp.]|nr:immunoglobulin domain-containing protein [Methanothrix sp.]
MGTLAVFYLALGAGQSSDPQISITVPSFDLNWNLDPRTNPNTQHEDLIVNSSQPWSITVSAQTRDNDGCMAEGSMGDGFYYAAPGKKLHSAMKISANFRDLNVNGLIGHDVDLSQGGILLEGNGGEGELHIPVVVNQDICWQDEPLGGGHVYHMVVSFIATQEEGCIPPSIDTFDVAPLERQVVPGETATLKVGASGSGLTYQWFKGHGGGEATYAYTSHQYYGGYGIYGATLLKDGGHISGANTSTLNISDFDCSDNGTYLVIVSNLCGFDYDSTSLNEYYSLDVQPEYQELLDGDTAIFSVAVDPLGDYSYQWQKSTFD